MNQARSLYRLFQRADGAASVRSVIVAMILVAAALTTVGVIRVKREHEVLELGYRLAKRADTVKQLTEVHRKLELERATLTAPDRIRRLATQLGMTPVAPDRIRIVSATEKVARE
ncbi:MAG: cell division protein FtsL [Kofleriaceae bacterium]